MKYNKKGMIMQMPKQTLWKKQGERCGEERCWGAGKERCGILHNCWELTDVSGLQARPCDRLEREMLFI